LQAVKENGRVAVLLDPDGDGQLDGNYSVFIDENMNWNLDGGEILLAAGEIRTGVRVTGATFDQFGFNSRGLLVVNRNTITLSNSEGRTKSVTIEVTGNARIN
jgi:hypothetical protein